MASYLVTAVDTRGKTVQEFITADSSQELLQTVKGKNLYLLDYKESKSESVSVVKLSTKSLVVFCRQLGTMIRAGIPIMQSLDMLQGKADSPKSRKIYRNVYEEVQKGNSLSDSMMSQKGAFPELLVNMVQAGELGGTLDESLDRMSVHFEKEAKLSNKIKSASIYPAILGFVSVAVVLGLVVFVLPTITSMFDSANMPWTTKILLAVSDFILENWIAIIGLLVFLIVTFRLMLNIREFRIQYDKFKLFMPVFGKLNQTVYSARAARAFASLYSSGVQMLDMIETTGRVLGNAYLEEMFKDVITAVSRGEYISKAIADTQSFDPMLSSMIFIGEESGSLGDILSSTADYFDNEADSAVQRMISLIEPVMIVVLGVIIGFIVVSIIQPIFQMYGAVGV